MEDNTEPNYVDGTDDTGTTIFGSISIIDNEKQMLNAFNTSTANDAGDDDDEDDLFVMASKRQDQLVNERRIQRRKRLREIAASATTTATDDDDDDNDNVRSSSVSVSFGDHLNHNHNNNTGSPPPQSQNSNMSDEMISANPPPQQQQVSTIRTNGVLRQANDDMVRNNDDDNNKNDNDDDDEFDMFSSSVTPPNHQTTSITMGMDDDDHHHHDKLQQQDDKEEDRLNHATTTNTNKQQQQQDWDDSEGYYKAVIGEIIDLLVHPTTTTADVASNTTTTGTQLPSSDAAGESTTTPSSLIRVRVAGLIGKGVFSTVLKCTVISNTTSLVLPVTIAMKCIRHNDSMTKTALTTELSILHKLHNSPGIVPLLLPTISSSSSSSTTPILEYRGHVLFVFPCMEYNLREVLQKFGKGIGLSLPAVRSYFGQLLAALSHLQKFHIIHADIKPDNILVRADFAVIQIADFGSAIDLQSPDYTTTTLPTPYLVSRFYRAPEIILGLVPITHMIDLWSVAVTVGELYVGDVLFRGTSNNDMLYVFQQHLGPFTNRTIRQHLIQCTKYATSGGTQQQQQLSPHFQLLPGTGNSYHFTQRTTDTVTGVPVLKVLSLVVTSDAAPSSSNSSSRNTVKFPLATPLSSKLLKAKSAKDTRKMVQQFIDLLYKCFTLDYSRRITLKDALRHEFFVVHSAATVTANITTTETPNL